MFHNKIDVESQREDVYNILKFVKENSNMMEKLSKVSSEHSTLLNEHQKKLVSSKPSF